MHLVFIEAKDFWIFLHKQQRKHFPRKYKYVVYEWSSDPHPIQEISNGYLWMQANSPFVHKKHCFTKIDGEITQIDHFTSLKSFYYCLGGVDLDSFIFLPHEGKGKWRWKEFSFILFLNLIF